MIPYCIPLVLESPDERSIIVKSLLTDVLPFLWSFVSISLVVKFGEVVLFLRTSRAVFIKRVRRVDQCVSGVNSRNTFSRIEWRILLLRVTKCGLKHVWVVLYVLWHSPWIERVNVLFFKGIHVWFGLGCSVLWLDDSDWRVGEVIDLVLQVASLVKSMSLGSRQVVFCNCFKQRAITIYRISLWTLWTTSERFLHRNLGSSELLLLVHHLPP